MFFAHRVAILFKNVFVFVDMSTVHSI